MTSSRLGRVGGILAVVIVLGGCTGAAGESEGGCVGAITFDGAVYYALTKDEDGPGDRAKIGTGSTSMCDDGGDSETDAEADLEQYTLYEVDGFPTDVVVGAGNFDGGDGMDVFVRDTEWENQAVVDQLVERYGKG